jgi:hypothetical protein
MATVATFSGCGAGAGADRPVTAIARGIVTYRGEPVSEAVVVLQPSDKRGYSASAMTDREGRFDLKTFPPESGAVPGFYGVVIMKVSQEDVYAESEEGIRPKGSASKGSAPQPTSLIPARYSDPSKSELNVEVPSSGTDHLLFNLVD